jgi:hypothetical protein
MKNLLPSVVADFREALESLPMHESTKSRNQVLVELLVDVILVVGIDIGLQRCDVIPCDQETEI